MRCPPAVSSHFCVATASPPAHSRTDHSLLDWDSLKYNFEVQVQCSSTTRCATVVAYMLAKAVADCCCKVAAEVLSFWAKGIELVAFECGMTVDLQLHTSMHDAQQPDAIKWHQVGLV